MFNKHLPWNNGSRIVVDQYCLLWFTVVLLQDCDICIEDRSLGQFTLSRDMCFLLFWSVEIGLYINVHWFERLVCVFKFCFYLVVFLFLDHVVFEDLESLWTFLPIHPLLINLILPKQLVQKEVLTIINIVKWKFNCFINVNLSSFLYVSAFVIVCGVSDLADFYHWLCEAEGGNVLNEVWHLCKAYYKNVYYKLEINQ